MKILLPFLIRSRYLDVPQSLLAWISWLALLAVVIYLAWKWKAYNSVWGKRERITLILLTLSVPVAGLLIGVRLPADRALPPPGLPVDQSGPLILVFAAIPWVLAAGFLGPTPAACLAALSGLLVALWDTHSPFTPVEMALLAVLLAWALGQRYRTPVYRVLSHPLVTTLLLGLLYPAIVLIEVALTSGGILVTRLDYALTHLLGITLAFGVELLIAGLVGEVLRNAYPTIWGGQGLLLPSPAEKSLQARFLYGMAPLAFALIITLMIGDWIIAGNAARSMLRERMANAAQNAADTIPFFMEAGQNLISQLAADPRLYNSKPEQLNSVLSQDLKTVPYFRQLFVLDTSGSYSASYPLNSYTGAQAPVEEQMGIQLALNGVPFQSFTVPPAQGETTAQISFVAAILDGDKVVHGVLIGRSDLTSNPFTQPVLASLNNLAGIDGQGILLDENSRILYHPDRALVMTKYPGRISEQPVFYDGTASDGTRQLVYFQPAAGRPWAVVLTVPAHRAQELALQIAAPMLGIILVLAVLAVLMLSLGLKVITASLQNLSVEAGLIAQGQLDHKLPLDGEDEVGRLRRAFEQMRASLKARLDELNRLLLVSQGVASSLDIKEAVLPVLESALAAGGCAARVVLAPSIMPGLDGDTQGSVSFGLGPAKDLFAQLDEQILEMTRTQERVVLTNPSRPRLLNFTANTPPPEALLAVALRHENLYYGTLWVAYDKTHNFSEEEIRFLVTLAGQAALAAANNRLFLTAEIGRQRLAAILASTPDPVLVTDQNDHLLLANPAAWQVLGLGVESDEGHPIDKVIQQKALVDLLRPTASEKQSAEITLPNGLVYLATASSVIAEGQRVGRVCVLRDVTHFKELDALKSEFVSTVSHDLRSPLTLMRGYATMLEMVGELNDQQIGYVRKIVGGVESMSHLVNNLLDLGRIDAGIGLQLETVPIHDIVERVISALQIQASQKHIQLGSEIPHQTIPLIEADQALLQQALHNLIENSIKYTRAEGKITVRAQARQDRMIFEVHDTGIGISPMDQPRLFERFYRGGQPGSKEQRGTGLGLAIVKSIAERHGGQVWVESQLGKGSTFYLAIPLRQPVQLRG